MQGATVAEHVQALALPDGEYVLIGGGAMAIRGLRPTGDIDLVVSRRVFTRLKREGWEACTLRADDGRRYAYLSRGDVDVFPHFKRGAYRPETKVLIARAERINDINVMSLADLVDSKRVLNRPKDIADISLIEEYRRIHGI